MRAALVALLVACSAPAGASGPEGDPGEQGPPGARGEPGPAWVPDVYTAAAQGPGSGTWADCEAGDLAMGGGCTFPDSSGPMVNGPALDGQDHPVGHVCSVDNHPDDIVTAWVVCLSSSQ